jgi:hypothetical protein
MRATLPGTTSSGQAERYEAGTSSGRNAFSSPRAPLRESGTNWDRHCEHRYVSASHDWTISSDNGRGEVLQQCDQRVGEWTNFLTIDG